MRLSRRPVAALAVVTGLPALLVALPVVSRPAATPHPVAPHVRSVPVHAGGGAGPLAGALAALDLQKTDSFSLVGATWEPGTLQPGAHVEMRTRSHGTWSAWTELERNDAGADGGSADDRVAKAAGAMETSEPVYVGDSDGVQLRVVAAPGATGRAAAPRRLAAVLVDPGRSDADAEVGKPATVGGADAMAAASRPTIYSRAQWGADERLRLSKCPEGPDYASTIKVGFVHHTVNSNTYASGDVPALIRGIYAYHVNSNGWCDVGYNFIVDRFGRIWEGRAGGVDRPVIGAHTGGFNNDSFAASLLGTHDTVSPSSAALAALDKLYAWKLGLHYRNPNGYEYLTAATFSGSRYAAGTNVRFRSISGHRDADYTGCPGDAAYATIDGIRKRAGAIMSAGFVAPSVTPASRNLGDTGGFSVTAGLLTTMSFTLTVTDAGGTVVRAYSGMGSGSLAMSWDGRTSSGQLANAGTYTLTLTGKSGTGSALPWSTKVSIKSPFTASVPATGGYGTTVPVTGAARPNVPVTFSWQRSSASEPTVQQITSDGSGNWRTSFPLTEDTQWSATDGTVATQSGTVRVAPTAEPLPFAQKGSSVTVSGTAMPGEPVTLSTQQAGASTWATQDVMPSAGGSWSASFPLPVDTTWFATSRGISTGQLVTRAIAPPTASGPAEAGFGTNVLVTGSAGGPVQVQLWTQPKSGGTASVVQTVTALSSGAFRVSFPLTGDRIWWVTTDFGSTQKATTLVAPTATGPGAVDKGSTATITGTALPGSSVAVYVYAPGATPSAATVTRVADSSGGWSYSFTAAADRQWYAVSRTLKSTVGTTKAMALPKPGSRLAVQSPAAGTVDLFNVSNDGDVQWRVLTGDTWSDITSLGGAAKGGPAVVRLASGDYAVFVRGGDDAVWWRSGNAQGWSGWRSAGGAFTSEPAAHVDSAGRVSVFGRGGNGALYTMTGDGRTWSRWTSLGGGLLAGTAPGASPSGSALSVAIVGTNGLVYTRSLGSAGWAPWQGSRMAAKSSPATSFWPGVPWAMFVKGADGALWMQAPAITGSWTSIGGGLTSAAGVITDPGRTTHVFVWGTDNHVWRKTAANGSWAPGWRSVL